MWTSTMGFQGLDIWANYLPQHQVGQLSYDIDGWGISLAPAWMPEALLFDHLIVYRHILYGLEKWYLYT